MVGGDKFRQRIKEIAANLKNMKLKIGFFENSTYPDGTPVAYIAYINEFGATINIEAHEQTIFRQLNGSGSFNKNGRFVKKKDSNYSTTHNVAAHVITIPARPAFRQMIEENRDQISGKFAALLKANNYDVRRSLELLGEYLKDQLYMSYNEFTDPPNAPSTVKKKGFNKPLTDTGLMKDSIGSEVSDG